MNAIERRAFMKGAGSGVLAFTVGGVEVLLTPGAARTQGVPFRTLTAAQAATQGRHAQGRRAPAAGADLAPRRRSWDPAAG